MPALNKEQILAAQDIKIEKVNVPEWGEGAYVNVRCLSGLERDAFEAGLVSFVNGVAIPHIQQYRSRLCAIAICDDEGKRVFTDREIAEIGKKNGVVLDRIADAASRLSGLDKDAIQKAAEDLKNAPPADLPSD